MNSAEFTDPQLQSLEAQLVAAVPQLDAGEQQRMLYVCAFGAGAQSARSSVRRWQTATGLLSVLSLGLAVPMTHDQFISSRESSPPQVVQSQAPQSPVTPEVAAQKPVEEPQQAVSVPPAVGVNLDAWQVPDNRRESWTEQLARSDADPQANTLKAGQPWRPELF